MKHTLITLALVCSCAATSMAEVRAWTLNSGKTVEAEFIALIGGEISLKTIKGKLIKIPENDMSPDDMTHIELQMPPTLDIKFTKLAEPRVYPPILYWDDGEPPRSLYYTFSTQIKQTSANPYDHQLTAEIFVMAVEADGGKNILLDRRTESFHLTVENKRVVNIQGAEDLMLTNYIAPGGKRRGEKYAGYMIVVTDSRGEVVAHKATREWWYEKIDNIRNVPVSKTFDEEGKRCWPTRPKKPDY